MDPPLYSLFSIVLGDDNEMISISLTVGVGCQQSDKICVTDYGGPFEETKFAHPVMFRPKCGTCGRHTTVNGDLDGIVNFGAHTLRHASLKATVFTGVKLFTFL